MTIFNQPVDTSTAFETYFQRQQQCQEKLKLTNEPIRDITMKRTARGHFMQLPHLTEWVPKYDHEEDPTGTGTWGILHSYFIEKDIEHKENQATLSQAGIANNTTVSNDGVDELKYHIANLAAKNTEMEEAMTAMMIAAQVEFMKQPPPQSAPPTTATNSDIHRLLQAFAAQSAPMKAAPPKTDIELLLAKALGNNTITNDPGKNQKPRKPSPKCKWYCWSHGCNFTHSSNGCINKKDGHQDTATCANKLKGNDWNTDIYTGPT
jgi:hypothetical protein